MMTDDRSGTDGESSPPNGAASGREIPVPSTPARSPGADPGAVRTNIGASDGAVPASYGAGGGLADAHEEKE